MPDSDREREIDPAVGLCAHCRFARVQTTARGGRFWRCLRSDDDPRFPRYPRLPITACPGYDDSRAV